MSYKFEFTVTNEETGEHVTTDWTLFDEDRVSEFGECEAVDIHVGSALRYLRRYHAHMLREKMAAE